MKPNTKNPKTPPQPQVKKGRKKDIKKLKNVERMEKMKKKKNPQKKDNLYKIKNRKYTTSIIKQCELIKLYDNGDFLQYMLPILKKDYSNKINTRNKHKRKSGFIIKKLGIPKEKLKLTIEKPPTRCATGECVVCLSDKKMTDKNTIKCGNTVNVLCEDCKGELKKNECPLCRSHPINPVSEIKPVSEINNVSEIYRNTNYNENYYNTALYRVLLRDYTFR